MSSTAETSPQIQPTNGSSSRKSLEELLYDIETRVTPHVSDQKKQTRSLALDEAKRANVAQARAQIQKDYSLWKRFVPCLYDFVATHVLEWPSLTLQWLPSVSKFGGYATCEAILGSNGGTEAPDENSLIVADVRLPTTLNAENTSLDIQHDSSLSLPPRTHTSKLRTKHRIVLTHPNRNLIACKLVVPAVHVYNTKNLLVKGGQKQVASDHDSKGKKRKRQVTKTGTEAKGHDKPELVLVGHEKDGYGVSWSNFTPGSVVSGSDDGLICLWDVQSGIRNKDREVPALRVFKKHQSIIGDVQWHLEGSMQNVFGSVSDDSNIGMWDVRADNPMYFLKAHEGTVNCLAFSPFHEHVYATGGGSDHLVKVWDIRKPDMEVRKFDDHRGDVFNIQWSPVLKGLMASCGVDRRVLIWDMNRTGATQTQKEALDGPPELAFLHAGHTDKVFDVAWHPDPDFAWYLLSCGEDNIIQMWSMNENLRSPPANTE